MSADRPSRKELCCAYCGDKDRVQYHPPDDEMLCFGCRHMVMVECQACSWTADGPVRHAEPECSGGAEARERALAYYRRESGC